MKASLYPETKLSELPEGIDCVHLVRPVGKKKTSALLRIFPAITRVTLSKSCSSRLSPAVRNLLKGGGIELRVKAERGRAISIPLKKMHSAIDMRRDFRSLREIEQSTGIPKSTVHYLVKYSQRKKVKNGKNVIYLK